MSGTLLPGGDKETVRARPRGRRAPCPTNSAAAPARRVSPAVPARSGSMSHLHDVPHRRRPKANPFRRNSFPPSPVAVGAAVPCRLLDLPDDVLRLVCFHAIRSHSANAWITPADLASPTSQSWMRVSRAFYHTFHATVTRFSFFLVNPHASTPRAARAHSLILPTLSRCTALRELQLFIRPRDLSVASSVARFFATTVAPLSTIHLCCAPPASSDPLRAGDPLPVVTDLIRSIASRGPKLAALSLDCCNSLSHTSARLLADAVGPHLVRLALDVTFFQDWTVLSRFTKLEELRLQNTRLISDTALRHVLQHLPSLAVLEIHQVPAVSGAGLRPLAAVGRLRSIELSRCIGVDDDAVRDLAAIESLTSVSLCNIDVSAAALQALARRMGARLVSLAVNSMSASGAVDAGGDAEAPSPSACLRALVDTVRRHCRNVEHIDFGPSPKPASHWSVRPFEEALRRPPAASCGRWARSGAAAAPPAARPAFRIRPSRRASLGTDGGRRRRPLSSCF
jgi:hypothetical protein